MSETYYHIFCFLFAGSVSLIYVALAFSGGSLLGVIKDAPASKVANGDTLSSSDIHKIFESIPHWLDPLFVLIVFVLFFSTKLNNIVILVRDLLADGSGVYAFVEEKAELTARELLNTNGGDFEKIRMKLSSVFGEFPIPEIYVGETNSTKRLAYQLIWASVELTQIFGPTGGMNSSRKRLGLKEFDGDTSHINATHLAASGFLFFVLMIVYIIVIPMFGGPARRFGVGWPDPTASGWSTLVLFILCNTLTVVVPLIFGIGMYPLRRKAYGKNETPLATLLVVAAAQWLVAFFVQEIFNVIDVSFALTHGMGEYTFFLGRIHISAFLYSLAPIIAFAFMMLLGPRLSAFGVLAGLTCVAIGIDFFLCDAIYEYYCPDARKLFWHQAVLGLWIMFSFFVAASANWRIKSITDTEFVIENVV